MKIYFNGKQIHIYLLFLALIFSGCITPEEPEFDFKDNLIFIEAIASNNSTNSYVKINESYIINNHFLNSFVSDAKVVFKNLNTKEEVVLDEEKLVYRPDDNFKVTPGETWELQIDLPDGRVYKSMPETILEPVAITDISAAYNRNLKYDEGDADFVPGHQVSISFNDPPSDNNYYYWAYKAFEKKSICFECPAGTVYRNGECQTLNNPAVSSSLQFDYYCENDCWSISFNENVSIFSDEFSNGNSINSLAVADILLNTKEDILVEIQQFSLSAPDYEYYKILKDILDNNGSLNAPPPAAFIGNIYNPNDNEEIVLGKFTAASYSTKAIFIDRTDIAEQVVGGKIFRRFEICDVCNCTPSCFPVTKAPCEESRFSTSIKPEGWID